MSVTRWDKPAYRTIHSPAGPCLCGGHCMAGEVECSECAREAARHEASHTNQQRLTREA